MSNHKTGIILNCKYCDKQFYIIKARGNWSAWSVYKNKSYLKFYESISSKR